MPVISDSSPLILYAKTGMLELIHQVFGEIWIPAAVYGEIVVRDGTRPGGTEIRQSPWITVIEILEPLQDTGPLDEGEAEVLALALQLNKMVPVLLDDAAARRAARSHGLRLFGSGGVLVEAKRLGLISAVRPALSTLIGAGLYLNRASSITGDDPDGPEKIPSQSLP